jgi:putative flippase GtrA
MSSISVVRRPPQTVDQASAAVDVVIPVYNEADGLERSVVRLHAYLSERFPVSWRITIADNASTDSTWSIATGLAARLDRVGAIHLDQKGRGLALRTAWSASSSAVVAYMDVDLSTDLDALLPLVAPLLSGHSDLAIGTRLALGANVVRGPKRELISRTYNLLLKAVLRSGFSDAQCGFKAIRTDVARSLLPLVADNSWFFDTELLVLAERNGLRIHEVAVDWVDDPDSRVKIASTATGDLRGIWRLLRTFAAGRGRLPTDRTGGPRQVEGSLAGQLCRFAGIGVVSTIVFGALFALLVPALGPIGADLTALGLCSVANTAANRRLTFSLRSRERILRDFTAATALALLPLAATVLTLLIFGALGIDGLAPQLLGLTVVNGAATVGRFWALRGWVFSSGARGPQAGGHRWGTCWLARRWL